MQSKYTEALKQALTELSWYEEAGLGRISSCDAIHTIREALEKQPAQQEPVAELVVSQYSGGKRLDIEWNLAADAMAFNLGRLPLYTHPAQRTWVGLTDEEIKTKWPNTRFDFSEGVEDVLMFARAIEAAHQIGVNK